MITSIVVTICCIVGIVGIYIGNFTLVLIGAIADIIENLIGVIFGGQNNLVTVIFAIIIGSIVGSNSGNLLLGILSALCWEGAIVGLLSIPSIIVAFKNYKTNNEK